jgi:hypothetical protein
MVVQITITSRRLATLGFLIALAGDGFLALWVGRQANPAPFYGPLILEWMLYAILGLLGVYLAASGRSRRWLYLALVGMGGLISVSWLLAFSLVYFTLPSVLAYGTAAVLATDRRGWELLGPAVVWVLLILAVSWLGIAVHVLTLRAVWGSS